MQSLTHYVDLAPGAGSVLYELYGRVLKAAHLSNQDGHSITVDWPGWNDQPGCFGPAMRLLGSQAAIEHCLTYIDPLVAAQLITLRGVPASVPADAECLHGYRRFRKPDKGSPSHQRRLERRCKARGEAYEAGSAEWLQASHKLPMQSKSTGQRFHVFIKRVDAADFVDDKPCAYGLGRPVPRF